MLYLVPLPPYNNASLLLDKCGKDHFTCENGHCTLGTWKCDGEDDFGDLSDKENCPGKKKILRVSTFFDPLGIKLYRHHISANSFRGNYSFLNLTLCTVTLGQQVRKLFKGGNYSRKYGIFWVEPETYIPKERMAGQLST